jgi:ATP-dependent protease HslVU (ClpYQ) peptidase subunit
MTIIAAKRDGRIAAIGGDSGAFGGEDIKMVSSDEKVWQVNNTLIGSAGNYRVIELAKKANLSDPYALRDNLLQHKDSLDGEWSILVVTARTIYEISEDFSVIKIKDNYNAIGSNGPMAIGALASVNNNPKDDVKLALQIVCKHSIYALEPTLVLTTTPGIRKKG